MLRRSFALDFVLIKTYHLQKLFATGQQINVLWSGKYVYFYLKIYYYFRFGIWINLTNENENWNSHQTGKSWADRLFRTFRFGIVSPHMAQEHYVNWNKFMGENFSNLTWITQLLYNWEEQNLHTNLLFLPADHGLLFSETKRLMT